MKPIISVENLGKAYYLGRKVQKHVTLRDTVAEFARGAATRMRQRLADPATRPEAFWAVRNANFAVNRGEVMGLVGRNGAGKSTILKVLSRITEPTEGRAVLRGRVASLLEVGTGFHPELTGRENIFLNGAILGMSRKEIERKFDEIVGFADVERFLDTPVKRYSSGMSVRLAFAVAAHLEPEILLVDEVLAVGDAAFQRKSLAKMGEVAKAGATVIFVSHNLATIQALCERGILLERGRVIADAPVQEAVDQYLRTLERAASDDLLTRKDRNGWEETLVERLYVEDVSTGQPDVLIGGRPARIVVEFTELLPMMECSLTILNSLGHPITTLDSQLSSTADERTPELEKRMECEIPGLNLIPGRYRIDVSLKGRQEVQDNLQAASFFDVEPGLIDGRPMAATGADGDV